MTIFKKVYRAAMYVAVTATLVASPLRAEIDLTCDQDIESLVQGIQPASIVTLCVSKDSKIEIDYQGVNRMSVLQSDGLTLIFNLFRGRNGDPNELASKYTLHRVFPRVWRVEFTDKDGEQIKTYEHLFVWSRDFDQMEHRKNDYALQFGPNRIFRCKKLIGSETVSEIGGCITYYNALVCEGWNHGTNPRAPRQAVFPVIAIRSNSTESSYAMMQNFESLHARTEIYLRQILEVTCKDKYQ